MKKEKKIKSLPFHSMDAVQRLDVGGGKKKKRQKKSLFFFLIFQLFKSPLELEMVEFDCTHSMRLIFDISVRDYKDSEHCFQ